MSRMSACASATALALSIVTPAAPARADTLLDNGTLGGSGRTVSYQWTVFQPFTVTGDGWYVETIGVDGFADFDPLGLGMLGTLLPENAAHNPDESNPIASAVYDMGEHQIPPVPQWRDEPFGVELAPGRYWMRWSHNGDEGYFGAIWRGTSGEPSFSRNEFTGSIFPSDPTALRICGIALNPSCPADFDGSGSVAFADLIALLSAWGPCEGCPYDLSGDGVVSFADLVVLLGAWGPCE